MDKKFYLIAGVIALIFIVVIVFANRKDNDTTGNNTNNNTVINQTPNVQNKVEEFVNVQANGTKVNKSEKFSETRVVDGLEITNIKLTENGNLSKITADVKNTSDKTKGDFVVALTILDKEGKTIIEVKGYINKVEAGKTIEFRTESTADFANAYDFKIVKE